MTKKTKAQEHGEENVDKEQLGARITEFLDKCKKNGSVPYKELSAFFEELHLDADQIDKFYETLDNLGVEVVDEDFAVTITDDMLPEASDLEEIEELEEGSALQDISHMPARVKCAVLGWHTMEELLDK